MDLLMGLTGSYAQFQAAPIRHYVNQTLRSTSRTTGT